MVFFHTVSFKLKQVTLEFSNEIRQVETIETSGYSFSGVKCKISPNACFFWEG